MAEISEQKNLLAYYFSLPEKSATTIRFFNRGDFFTVIGPDALLVAKHVFKSTNNVKIIGHTTEWLSLNKNQFAQIVRELILVLQYSVEVYEGKGAEWSLEYRGSPGNITQLEHVIYSGEEGAGRTVLALRPTAKAVGVAAVTVDLGSLAVCDVAHTEVEALLVQTSPKEIILPESCPKNLVKAVERFGCPVKIVKCSMFSVEGLDTVLNRLIAWEEGQCENSKALPQMKLEMGCAALHAALVYTELVNDETQQGKFTLETLTPEQYVHVDTSAGRALGICGSENVLERHLDRCCTTAGRRLLSHWLRHPLRDVALIEQRLDMVQIFFDETELRACVNEDFLRGLPDVEMLARRVTRKAATLTDCYKVYQALTRVGDLICAIGRFSENHLYKVLAEQIVTPLQDNLKFMDNFQQMVAETVDINLAEQGQIIVNSSFSEELGTLWDQMDSLMKELNSELAKSAQLLGLEQGKSIKLETNPQLGYHFRTPNKKVEQTVRENGMKTIDSTKAGLRFRSVRAEKINSDWQALKQEYDSCQRDIVQEIVNIAAGYAPSMMELSQILAKLDVVASLASVAANAPTPYVRPKVLPRDATALLKFKALRHPVMETLDNIPSFIPNDVNLSHDGHIFEIITGPNMGGKSTYLRAVGVICVLAQIGSFVPCDEAEMTVVDAVLARVGASDCQTAGVSTFMNEMLDTAAILKKASSSSLVLIDELGRGTSTYEGCGLAWAIAKELAEKTQSFTLFATHFQELTQLESEVRGVKNRHVGAVTSDDGLTLLFQLQDGPTDRSFGIEVARAAKLPAHIIHNSREKLKELEQGWLGQSELTPDEIKEGEQLVQKLLESVIREPTAERMSQLADEFAENPHPFLTTLLA